MLDNPTRKVIVIEDNAPCYEAAVKMMEVYRIEHGIYKTEWLANLSDLYIIEDLWIPLKNAIDL